MECSRVVRKIFAGLMSRWVIPLWCAASNPSAICIATSSSVSICRGACSAGVSPAVARASCPRPWLIRAGARRPRDPPPVEGQQAARLRYVLKEAVPQRFALPATP